MINKSGFTLIEILITIAMIAIVLAFSSPSINQWRQSSNNKAVARDILSSLRHARSVAITGNRDVEVSLDLDDNIITYADKTINLSTNSQIEASIDDSSWASTGVVTIVFESRGTCTNHLYVKVNSDNNLKVKIDSTASGLARF